MASKNALRYARELLGRGFTKDTARNIMASRGFSQKDISDALNLVSKPGRRLSLTALIGIAIVLLLLLIPTLFFLTKDRVEVGGEKFGEAFKPVEEISSAEDELFEETEKFQCTIDEECSFQERCEDGYCTSLNCGPCEDAYMHQCTPISCDDLDLCTEDFCSNGVCINELITDCILEGEEIVDVIIGGCETDLDCFDGDPLTLDLCEPPLIGMPKECVYKIPGCSNGDEICPPGCSLAVDNDCEEVCGNNITEGSETCDGDNCPLAEADCDDLDACTSDSLLGSAAFCTSECVYTEIIENLDGDGCCPPGSDWELDKDCEQTYSVVGTGSFASNYGVSGGVEIKLYEDGTYKIALLEDFYMSVENLYETSDVYLSKQYQVNFASDITEDDVSLGAMSGAYGQQEYDAPIYIVSLIENYKSVVIYSDQYKAVYGYATIMQ
tara:strand:- start:4107 stop:5426 length:1320 start_codon:yes stop_codon:yes gene_type:complete